MKAMSAILFSISICDSSHRERFGSHSYKWVQAAARQIADCQEDRNLSYVHVMQRAQGLSCVHV